MRIHLLLCIGETLALGAFRTGSTQYASETKKCPDARIGRK